MTIRRKNSHSLSHGHYCIICNQFRNNKMFSGKGHVTHICKDCMKLPMDKRNEIQTVNKIMNLPLYLNHKQQSWLEKIQKDRRYEVREAAEWAYELRFPLTDESQCRCTQEDSEIIQ